MNMTLVPVFLNGTDCAVVDVLAQSILSSGSVFCIASDLCSTGWMLYVNSFYFSAVCKQQCKEEEEANKNGIIC